MKLKWKGALILLLALASILVYLIAWSQQPTDKSQHQRSETELNNFKDGGKASNDERTDFTLPPPVCSYLYHWPDNPPASATQYIPVCASTVQHTDSIQCQKSSLHYPPIVMSMLGITNSSTVINVTCSFKNIAVAPFHGKGKFPSHAGAIGVYNSHLFRLSIDHPSPQCPVPVLEGLKSAMNFDDTTLQLTEQIALRNPTKPSICESWFNETVYIYVPVQPNNVYFTFLQYYNIYHTLLRTVNKSSGGPSLIIKFDNGVTNSRFKDFENRFFSKLTPLHSQKLNFSQTVCFCHVVLVPRSFSNFLFQCVSNKDIRKIFMGCSSYIFEQTKRNGGSASLLEFRDKVLEVCGIMSETRKDPLSSHPMQILFIQRQPYISNGHKSIERQLSNEEELLAALANNFPSTQIKINPVRMEKFDICSQIRMANSADVLMGVHGAGLVHLWWMKEDGWVLELVPKKKDNKPFIRITYKILSAMLGKNYQDIPALNRGIRHDTVTVDPTTVVKTLRTLLDRVEAK